MRKNRKPSNHKGREQEKKKRTRMNYKQTNKQKKQNPETINKMTIRT